jgi:putative tryptophan/tyrosine transport system substrate-binding protein
MRLRKQLARCCAGLSLLLLLSSCTGTSEEKDRKIPLAILTPATHPSLEQIEQGFKETMEAAQPGKYCFVTYNAQGSKTLMRAEVEEILQQDYPLIFTLGSSSSQMAVEVCAKKGSAKPIVFTCVHDPLSLQLVSSEEAPGGSVTGVKELLDLRREVALLVEQKPSIRKVLLVLNPMEPGIDKDGEEVRQLLAERGVETIAIEVFQTNEIVAKVLPFMLQGDALLVFKDNTVVGGLDALVKLCDQYHLPLMARDLDSPDRGAAFGYGVYEREFGVEGAKKALCILEEGRAPGSIPVTPVTTFTLKVNRTAALAQGIPPEALVAEAEEEVLQ